MKRLRSMLLLPVLLLFAWLLLNDSIALGHILLGSAFAILLAWIIVHNYPQRVVLRRPRLMLVLLGRVVIDIIRSNIAVAHLILSPMHKQRTAGFIRIPLVLRNPYALTTLAMIVTSTPGTVWAGLSADGSTLMLHVLDLGDESQWIATIKNRYEQPLLEIFA